jgi:hypothetical protein
MNSITHTAGFEMDRKFHALIIQIKSERTGEPSPSAFLGGDLIIPRTLLGEEAVYQVNLHWPEPLHPE